MLRLATCRSHSRSPLTFVASFNPACGHFNPVPRRRPVQRQAQRRIASTARVVSLAMETTDQNTSTSSHIAQSLKGVRERIAETAAAAGVPAPRLVAVSKLKPVSDLMEAYDAGQRDFGENYVQELVDKAPQMPDDVKFHFIGSIQTKKANGLVAKVPQLAVVESVDSAKLASKLNDACVLAGREKLPIFLQVDTSGEETKSGVEPEKVVELASHVLEECPKLSLEGLMTIGAPGDLGCFDRLVQCRDTLAAELGDRCGPLELSMGMSDDFEEAIRRGSTNVRVGSTIFGARPAKA